MRKSKSDQQATGIEEMKKHNTIFVSLTENEKQEAEKTAKESTRNIIPEAA